MKDCNQCGKCCTKYGGTGLSVSDEEIASWGLFSPDIADYVRQGEIWFSPSTGKQLQQCPWLQKIPNQDKYTCDIYFDRPNDCRYYPVTVGEMVRDECEMIEAHDLTDIKKSQRELDNLMTDSRPPLQSRN